ISPEIIRNNIPVNSINNSIWQFLNEGRIDNIIPLLIGEKGPLWYRGYMIDEPGISFNENELENILSYFDAKTIIFAHTEVSHIKPLFNKKLIAVDVPLSSESAEGLFIKDNEYYRVTVNGKRMKL
ncbi:MAG: hypothetical protein ABEH43_01775, partial [Flavobacteriales bacterium]